MSRADRARSERRRKMSRRPSSPPHGFRPKDPSKIGLIPRPLDAATGIKSPTFRRPRNKTNGRSRDRPRDDREPRRSTARLKKTRHGRHLPRQQPEHRRASARGTSKRQPQDQEALRPRHPGVSAKPATTYSPSAELGASTIGPGGLNCRVLNGNGCFPAGIVTGLAETPRFRQNNVFYDILTLFSRRPSLPLRSKNTARPHGRLVPLR